MKIKHKITFEFIIDKKNLDKFSDYKVNYNDNEDLAEFIDNYLVNDDDYSEGYIALSNSNFNFDTETTIIN